MYTTIENTRKYTGYEVTQETLLRAQGIIEAYTGRLESDVSNVRDTALLGKATAYQAAYMRDNYEQVFEQVALSQTGQSGTLMTFKAGDDAAPFIAPLAVLACKKLSWFRSRSVKTGRSSSSGRSGYYDRSSDVSWWTD